MFGIIVTSLGGLLLIAGALRLFIRADRINRERAKRRREIWEAEGRTGACPGDYMGSSGGGSG